MPIQEIVNLYINGVSELALSKRFGVSRCTIRGRLVAAGIQPRTQSESEAVKWKQMSKEARQHQVKAAHDKVRGMTRTHDNLVNRAIGVQAKAKMSKFEQLFFEAFTKAGVSVIPEYAIDVFNIDFAIPEKRVAIEVDGGNWHTSSVKSKYDRRKEAFLKQIGWHIIRFQVYRRNIENILSEAVETVRTHPAMSS